MSDCEARLALDGGTPVRRELLPYGRQTLDEDDIAAVVDVLRSDLLTTGPVVDELEQVFADFVGAKEAVAVSSGTAALHSAMYAMGVKPGHEVIVPAMTFAATANCVVYQGGTPVFADVDPDTFLLTPESAEERLTERTRAIIAVDYAGQPCDYVGLRRLADQHRLTLVADACHALGGCENGRKVGSLADLNVFSLHPVKAITSGEGGLVTTDDPQFARRIRTFRNHGITTDHRGRAEGGQWFYEMADLGFNYRITDFQCALGMSQLRKLDQWVERRQHIARTYDRSFSDLPEVIPLCSRPGVSHAYHLYVIRVDLDRLRVDRDGVFRALRGEGIGVNVHYIPVHLHPYYKEHFHTQRGGCPVAEAAHQRILSLPIFPAMTDDDAASVVRAVKKVVCRYRIA